MSEVLAGLKIARRATARFMKAAADHGFDPKEESITEHLLSQLPEDVTAHVFTRAQESRTYGADWLWWWTDGQEWFGSLIQAKRRRSHKKPYSFDFKPQPSGRNPSPRPQLETLLNAARRLQVPALYALYNGDRLPSKTVDRCECARPGEPAVKRLAVAAVPALTVQWVESGAMTVDGWWSPIECLACPGKGIGLNPVLISAVSREMKSFLASEMTLPRSVARRQLHLLGWARLAAFFAISPGDITRTDTDRLVSATGDDLGHFSEPWVEHVMRGLRRSAPDYLGRVMEGQIDEVPELTDLAGVVVVSDASERKTRTP